jgi:fatty-acyl-CoA synthase
MIVSGGFKLFPREIEDDAHPARPTSRCAPVVGVPDDKWGEAVTRRRCAARGRAAERDELIALVKAKKGSAHAPKQIQFVKRLPMTGVGKVDKKVLKAGFWAGRDRMVG